LQYVQKLKAVQKSYVQVYDIYVVS